MFKGFINKKPIKQGVFYVKKRTLIRVLFLQPFVYKRLVFDLDYFLVIGFFYKKISFFNLF